MTGCKYIGEKIREYEKTKKNEYIFGFEESFGCLIGTQTRDKDGMVAVTMFAEMVAYYKEQGISLWEQMLNIYEEYGYYREESYSIVLPGMDGSEKIKQMMVDLRQKKVEKIGEYDVFEIRDYNLRTKYNIKTKEIGVIELPKSNVLYYQLNNNSWCCVRPSGTEPKIKLYMGIKAKSFEEAEKKVNNLKEQFIKLINE